MRILAAKRLVLPIVFTILAAGAVVSQPTVEKVDPPNWWAGHSINPVRLLVRGKGFRPLDGSVATVSAPAPLKASNVRVNKAGTYLFVDVTIANSVKPGRYPLTLSTSTGKTQIPFDVSPRYERIRKGRGISNEDVIYLIMPDRFANGNRLNDRPPGTSNFANDRSNSRAWHGGDFAGIRKAIPYLKELGVTAIWLTPWYDNPDYEVNCDKPWCPNTNYHGYHAIDYYGVENRFGTMAELRAMIADCHRNGIKVIQDQVANHVGHVHTWMKDKPLPNWFSDFRQNSFNNSALLSPNASKTERDLLLRGWFNELLPDMNHDEPEVVRYSLQNALWWIEMTGIDGIRQDTIQYMPREFIRDWSEAILKEYPDFWMVGEIFERDSAQTAFFQGGKKGWDGIDTQLPAVFDFKLWETSQKVFTGKAPARALRDVLKYDGLYPDINNVVLLENNHDTDRFLSLKGGTVKGARLHTAFVLATRGIPQLYYGEEILMIGGHDPDNRKDFPGGWPDDKVNKFNQAGRTFNEQAMFEWTRDWIRARKQSAPLTRGSTTDLHYDRHSYVFLRRHPEDDGADVLVAFNTSSDSKEVRIRSISKAGSTVRFDKLVGDEGAVRLEGGTLILRLRPQSAVAYTMNGARR